MCNSNQPNCELTRYYNEPLSLTIMYPKRNKFLLTFVLILQTLMVIGQNFGCSNMDFEDGNFNNWEINGNVEIVNANDIDPYGGFPLALSGYYAIKLGNNQTPVLDPPYHSSVSRTFTITNSNKYFIYGFSIVLLGYPHSLNEASYVKLEVTDLNNEPIQCTEYIVHAQSSAGNGFYQSNAPNEENLGGECCYPIYYKPWEINAIDLSAYIGQTLTFNLISEWCVFDVDWGYAYVDVYCSDNILSEYYNCEDEKIYLRTVNGLSPYIWSGPGIVNGQGTNEIQINQPGTYTLDIPNPNSLCPPLSITYEATNNELPNRPIANFYTEFSACLGTPLIFENTSISDSYLVNIQWSFGDSDSSFLNSPTHIYDSIGNYIVELLIENEYGCTDSIEYIVSISNPINVDLGPDLFLCDGEKITISPISLDSNVAFYWSNGSSDEFIEISQAQEIILFATNGCFDSDTLLVHDHPAYFGPIPNVITPNNDNVNEDFLIPYNEIIDYQIIILNRWGDLVFESKNPSNLWNGKTEGKEVIDGVYFYKIDYRLSCQKQLQHKTGYISVLR
jgi:gliding motility-associated-like protein